jgi:DNA-binding transcriptional regulator YdaS (Cro superfamily)
MKRPNGYDRLYAIVGSQKRIADALGLTKEHVSRIANGHKKVPEYIDAVAELLERTPPQDWPARWK